MLVIIDSRPIGTDCIIDKNKPYSVYNSENNKIKTIKGSTILKNLKDDLNNRVNFRYINATSNRTFNVVNVDYIANKSNVTFKSDGTISNSEILNSFIHKEDDNNLYLALTFYENYLLDIVVKKKFVQNYIAFDFIIAGKKFSIATSNGLFLLNFTNLNRSINSLSFNINILYVNERQRNNDIGSITFNDNTIAFNNRILSMITMEDFLFACMINAQDDYLKDREIDYLGFKKESCLSNYYPCKVKYDGRVYNSSEAVYQSLKTTSKENRDKFIGLTPDESKHLGRSLPLRSDYNEVMLKIMYDSVYAKFTQNKELRDYLLSTDNDYLYEDTTAWHDNVWGSCNCPKCSKIEGKNYLGKVLMKLREDLKKEGYKADNVVNFYLIEGISVDDSTYYETLGEFKTKDGAIKAIRGIASERDLNGYYYIYNKNNWRLKLGIAKNGNNFKAYKG